MDSAQIRFRNFQKLFNDFVDQHAHLPQRGMLKLFAERLDFSDRYLSHIKCNRKNIGHNVARTIEARLKLPHGWMDREHTTPMATMATIANVNEAANATSHHTSTTPLLNPVDEKERLFIDTALTLFRSQPTEARELLLELLRERLDAKTSKTTTSRNTRSSRPSRQRSAAG